MSAVREVYLDDATSGSAGCGFRRVVVVKVGRKWVEALYPATVTKLRLPLDYFERNSCDVEFNKRVLAKIIRDNAEFRSTIGLRTAGKAFVREALQALGARR